MQYWFNEHSSKIAFCLTVVSGNLEQVRLHFVCNKGDEESFDVIDCENSYINHRYS